MGCANVKAASVDVSMREVSNNPAKGLPHLLASLKKSEQESDESAKSNVPDIFKVLPGALETLKNEELMKEPEPVLAACIVIERCVKLYNSGEAQPTIDGHYPKQCQHQLALLMKKVQREAETVAKSGHDCDISSQKAKAIARATIALFQLKNHATECKLEMSKLGGISAAVNALNMGSGINLEAKRALVLMFREYIEKAPENVENIVTSGGTDV